MPVSPDNFPQPLSPQGPEPGPRFTQPDTGLTRPSERLSSDDYTPQLVRSEVSRRIGPTMVRAAAGTPEPGGEQASDGPPPAPEPPTPEPRTDSSGTGTVPPGDVPPTTFAGPPEESEPEPEPSQAGDTPPVSDEAEALRRHAEELGLPLSPEDAEHASEVVRVTTPSTPSEHGPERPLRKRIDVETTARPMPTIDTENTDNVHSLTLLRSVGLQRLRSGDEPEPPEIASARKRVTKEANYRLGEIVWEEMGQEVTDLIPEHMHILRGLGDMLVNRAVSNHGIALEAASLGISATVHQIRERLLTQIGDKLPPGVNYVRPDVPMLTEGLTVGTRLDEFGKLVGITRPMVSERSGIELPIINFFMSSTPTYYQEPPVARRIMDALELPSTIAGPLLRQYNWERGIRERDRL